MFPWQHFILLGILLFATGLVIIITKRNAIMVLLGLELMLNAGNINLVAFNYLHGNNLHGQMFSLFVIIVAVCEAAVGLAIILRVYQHYGTASPDQVNDLKDRA